jgi:hypothetical protein
MDSPPNQTRGLFGSIIFALGALCLVLHLAGVARLAYDVVLVGAVSGLLVKVVILGLAFVFGLGLGTLSQRRFESPAFPLFARVYGWVYLALAWLSYLGITFVVNRQQYSVLQYGSFWALLVVELGAVVALRLVAPGRVMSLAAVPMLGVVLFHLLLLVYRYVFASAPVTWYLAGDLLLIIGMGLIATTMLGENAFRAVLDRVIEKTG